MTKKRVRPRPEFAAEVKLAEKLREFEYPDLDTKPPAPRFGGGGGAPTVVIAASDATELSKSKADFICLGVKDHDTILQAYSLLSTGGRMLLTEGTFFCAYGELVFNASPLTLQGMGNNSTLIQFSGTSGNGLEFSGGGDQVSDLGILDDGGASGAGIRFHAGEGSRVHRVLFGNSGKGLLLDSSTSAGLELVVSDCLFHSLGGVGIDATPASPHTGRGLIVANNQFVEVTGHAISLSRWSSAIITGNVFFNPPGAANRAIIATTPIVDVTIANNRLVSRGITLSGERFLIEGNHISAHTGHGIALADAHDCLVTGNMIGGTPSGGSVDRINLSGNSDRNYIVENYLYPTASVAKPRYGINISAATCDCNIVVGNRLGLTSDYNADALNDAGTDTQLVYPTDATYGDNFTDCIPSDPPTGDQSQSVVAASESDTAQSVDSSGGAAAPQSQLVVAVTESDMTQPVGSSGGAAEAGFVTLDGTGDSITTPDSAQLDQTTAIDIRVCASADQWDMGQIGALNRITLIGKWVEGTNNRSWRLQVFPSGANIFPFFTYSTGGTSGTSFSGQPATGFAAVDGTPYWFRVTFLGDNGSSQHVRSFYWSNEPPDTDPASVSWTLLQTITASNVRTIFNSVAAVSMGLTSGSEAVLAGKIYYAEIRSSVGGTIVANPDFRSTTQDDWSLGSGDDDNGNTWTLNGDAVWSSG